MKSAHHLYELIQSLSASEKSYLKKNSGIDGSKEKSYIILFDIINDMKVYDEKILINKLKKNGIEKSVSNLKDYLYELILENLVAYHKNTEEEFTLLQKYQKNKVLVKKGLFEQAKIYSRELRLEADEKQNHLLRLMSNDPYIISCSLHKNIQDLEEFIDAFEQSFTKDLNQIKNEYYLHLMFMKNAYYLKKNNYSHNKQEVEELRVDYKKVLNKFEAIEFPRNQSAYYNELGIYSYLTQDNLNEYIYKKQAFDIYLQNEAFIKSDLNNFSAICYTICWRNLMNRLYDQYDYIQSKIAQVKLDYQKKLSPLSAYQLDITYYGVILPYHKQNAQLNEHVKLIDEVKEWALSTNHLIYYMKNRIYEDIVESYFYTNQYDKAVAFIMQWLNDGDKNKVRNKVSAWIFLIIIHFEEGNYELVSSLVIPAIKYIRNCHLGNEYVLYFIKVFKRINNDVRALENKEYLQTLLNEFPQEENLSKKIGSFRFHTWLESKLMKCDYYTAYCKSLEGYNYQMLDQLIDLDILLYETEFLIQYKKTGIKI